MVNKRAEKEKYNVIHSFGTTEEQAETLKQWTEKEETSKSDVIRKLLFEGKKIIEKINNIVEEIPTNKTLKPIINDNKLPNENILNVILDIMEIRFKLKEILDNCNYF